MKIKVCGMKDGENIRQVSGLSVDYIGLHFCADSPRHVTMLSTHAGIIPDRGRSMSAEARSSIQKVGVFTNEMPQNIITRAVTFGLDIIQLNGEETPTLIRNLRATLVSDICPDIQFWKKAKPQKESYGKYEHAVEAFIFDMKDIDFLSEYEGTKPFFLCGTFTEKDAESIRNIRHPQLAGIDLSTSFESQPGIKDIERLKTFLDLLKN